MRESDRLNSIITNFLSYARPKAGNHVETDVCEAIRETVKLLRHSPEVSENHKVAAELCRGSGDRNRRCDPAKTDILEPCPKFNKCDARRRNVHYRYRTCLQTANSDSFFRYWNRYVRRAGRAVIRAVFQFDNRRDRARPFDRLPDSPRSQRDDKCPKRGG